MRCKAEGQAKHRYTCPPRFILWAFGTTSFSSLANCVSRLLGSLDVVMSTLGSRSPACAYSSSMWDLGTAVLSSSSSMLCRNACSSLRSSVGMGLPSAHQHDRPHVSTADHWSDVAIQDFNR